MEKQRIDLPETDSYYLFKDERKGVCVMAGKAFDADDLISINYTAIIDWTMDEQSAFQRHYPMFWTDEHACIAFGIVNLLNHSSSPNCRLVQDHATHTVRLICMQPIKPGEELVIDYGPEHFPFMSGETAIL
jgi:hypothetical protein